MARNRQRAKERRSRRTDGSGDPGAHSHARDESQSPLRHATPDAELAEAQLAVGRPELGADEDLGDLAEAAEAVSESEAGGAGPSEPDDGDDESAEGVVSEHAAVVHREKLPVTRRLAEFVQGSWRELQRVQWPDRRQVIQATGVVIGFVIVAGVFLGVADALAGKLVNLILK